MVYSDAGPYEQTLSATFGALSDPTRRAILVDLSRGERSIGELAAQFDMTLPGVTKHLRVLERAGLTDIRRDGRVRRCRLVGAPLRGAEAWIVKHRLFWEQQLNQFAAFLAANPEGNHRSTHPEDSAWPLQTLPPRRSAKSSSSDAPSPLPPNEPSKRGRTRKR